MDISLYGHFLFSLRTIMATVLDAIYTALEHSGLHTLLIQYDKDLVITYGPVTVFCAT